MMRWQWIVFASVLAACEGTSPTPDGGGLGDGGPPPDVAPPTDGGPRIDAPPSPNVLVVLAGAGSGRVTTTPAGIDCGSDCSEAFSIGATVTFTATPATGSTFEGWSGACSGTGTCALTIGTTVAVTATFALDDFSLTVAPAGTGGGAVTSDPAGIDCGTDCTEEYPFGTMVELTATPAVDSTFVGWSGGGCTGTGPCTTTIAGDVTITPTFDITQVPLTVTVEGDGEGAVTSDVGGIDCGATCSATYDFGTDVTLTATPSAGSAFTGWSGGCTGTDPCVVTLESATDVVATFVLAPFTGTIALLEEAVLNPGTSGTFFGQGNRMSITFEDGSGPAPVLDETPGSFFGCRAWSYTAAEASAAAIGIDEGPIQVDFPAGAGTSFFPACVFTAGVGYLCPHSGTASTGGVIGAGPVAGTATLTDVDVTFNAANTSNRYLRIGGAANAANNGLFPIVALAGANTIVYANPARVAETLPATATHINLAGVGPTPQAVDPGFLMDTATIDFRHMASANFPAFTATTGVDGVADDFVLAIADLNRLNAIPRDGSPFAFSCSGCSGSDVTMVDVVTTDGPTAGISPFAMPAPVTQSLHLRCAVVGSSTVSVPAAASALIMGSGATRIRTSFVRAALMSAAPPGVTAYAGHAIVGFTN